MSVAMTFPEELYSFQDILAFRLQQGDSTFTKKCGTTKFWKMESGRDRHEAVGLTLKIQDEAMSCTRKGAAKWGNGAHIWGREILK